MSTEKADNWVIMPIEVKNREFASRLLLSMVATSKGFKVLIGQDRVIRRVLPFLPKGIIFDKSIGNKKDRKVKLYSKYKFIITALDEEATGYLSGPESFAALRLSTEALDVTERWFCLSEPIRKDICRRFPDYKDRFVTTGLTRTDVWREDFQTIYDDEVQKIKKRYGKFILFNSNFATIIHARGDGFTNNQMARNTKIYKNYTKNKVYHKTQEQANLDAYLETLPKLCDWFPDHKLIVRPHPADDIKFWEDAFIEYPNIEVVLKGNVTPWILASDCLLHHGCTTGIESELMNKPHVMYAPMPDDHHDSEIMKSFAKIVKTEVELKNALTQFVRSGNNYIGNRGALGKYYASLEGELACKKIVEEFEKFSVGGGPLKSWISLLRFTPRQLVADYFPRSQRAKAYSLQKWDGATSEEISSKLLLLGEALGDRKERVVNEVYPGLFKICSR